MAAVLVSVAEFRTWSGAATASIPDSLIQDCLDEAEAGMLADVGTGMDDIQADSGAVTLARGEELRRASRLMARRNSPEGFSGYGDIAIQVASRDPDSYRTIAAIRSILVVPEGVA